MKWVLAFILTFTLTSIPTKSVQAGSAFIVSGPLAASVSLGVMGAIGAGVSTYSLISTIKSFRSGGRARSTFITILAVFGLGLSLIILDDQVSGRLQFEEISEIDAKKLGINEEGRISFNENLDLANLLLDTISFEVLAETSKIDGQQITDKATDKWAEYGQLLPEEALNVVKIVSGHYIQKIQENR